MSRQPSGSAVVRNGPLEIDLTRLSVRVNGRVVRLTGLQLKLVLHFARHPDWTFSRGQLLREVWGDEFAHGNPKVVDVVICRLRQRLGTAGTLIESVRSLGYRMSSTDVDAESTTRAAREERTS
jgi:two-component system phosphate regulon response regulator PhoB